MIRIVRNIAIAAGIAGAAAGSIDSGRTLKVVETSAEAWAPAEGRTAPGPGDLAERLLRTGQFRGPAKPAPANADDAGAEGSQTPEAPEIVATANLDGEIAVSFRSANGAIRTVRVGGEIEGAWKVEAATLEKVVLSRDGMLRELAVYPEKRADG
jgi:hypothetical protein